MMSHVGMENWKIKSEDDLQLMRNPPRPNQKDAKSTRDPPNPFMLNVF